MHHSVRAPKPWIRWLLPLAILCLASVIGFVIGQITATETSNTNAEVAVSSDTFGEFERNTQKLLTRYVSAGHYTVEIPSNWAEPNIDIVEGWHSSYIATIFQDPQLEDRFNMLIARRKLTLEEFKNELDHSLGDEALSRIRAEGSVSIDGFDAIKLETKRTLADENEYQFDHLFIPTDVGNYIIEYPSDMQQYMEIASSFSVFK